jgi:hypothetical protein
MDGVNTLRLRSRKVYCHTWGHGNALQTDELDLLEARRYFDARAPGFPSLPAPRQAGGRKDSARMEAEEQRTIQRQSQMPKAYAVIVELPRVKRWPGISH